MKYFGNLELKAGWKLLEKREDGFMAVGKIGLKKYTLISSVSKEQDGNTWHHLSVANPTTLPDYKVMEYIKANFMRKDKIAIEVHAPSDKHVDIHKNCRHLWSCLDKDVVPDFTNGTGNI